MVKGRFLFLADFGLDALVDRSLSEDLSDGDPTTDLLLSSELKGKAIIVARDNGVLSGIDFALRVFQRLDSTLNLNRLLKDGSTICSGNSVAEIDGSVASILKAERAAINIVQHLSGIATLTKRYVDAVDGYEVRILDTRKTTAGLRYMEKHAVRSGGGDNHRFNLGGSILVKDNHIKALKSMGFGMGDIVRNALIQSNGDHEVEIEVECVSEFQEVLKAGAKRILLDNMSIDEIRECVCIAHGRALLEASGGITLSNVCEVASTGVDFISVGSLTHSSKSLDIGLDLLEAYSS